ncbi:tetratricopeptide repeat protein [Dysgonomonas sp. Marseille-P4677]|uniref:tetratricopeptide repeat protein n=1 Tax=Dysgonomonas sp. Marseille-P4677 TaxID=2364790 RepID=UPI001A5ACC2D|nr:tetratricopeptide repeat protein [Dysgonomonas sp. Marseille-P4677]MBK5722115.1 tetratricopeptide repeat protein [Dysgonomonas sp. Marseille-P4677]
MGELIRQNPDSALQILNTLDISPLDEYNSNLYMLRLIQCRDRLNKDISKDNEIIDVYHYFKNNTSSRYIGLSAYYIGRVMHKNKEYQKAVDYYNIAESLAIKDKNNKLFNMILYSKGELMLNQLLFGEAKLKFAQANKLFREAGEYRLEITSYNNLASTYLYELQYDSSLYYYDKAIELAIRHNDRVEEAYGLKDKGVVYYDKGEYKDAIYYLNKAKITDSIVIKSGKVDLILSNVYLKMNNMDSMAYYAKNSLVWVEKENIECVRMLSSVYALLSKMEEKNGKYKDALDYHKSYSKYLAKVLKESKVEAIIDAEQKYKYKAAQKEITRLSLNAAEKRNVILGLSIVFLVVIIVFIWRDVRKKQKLSKAQEEILNLTDILEVEKQSQKSLKDYYVYYFNILKRAASLEYFVRETNNKQGRALIKKFNEIAYGQDSIDWDILYNTANDKVDGRLDKLRISFPILDDIEYKICSLIYADMGVQEIAVVLDFKVTTVNMRMTSIRKKLGVERYGKLSDFLSSRIQ